MNKVMKLPDPDWVIVKSTKYNGDTGYWYIVRHKHKKEPLRGNSEPYQREGTAATYCATVGGVREQYKCSWCNIPVPEEVQGYRNLVEWSEV